MRPATEQEKPLHVKVAEAIEPGIEVHVGPSPQSVGMIEEGTDFPVPKPNLVFYVKRYLKPDHDCVYSYPEYEGEPCQCEKEWFEPIHRFDLNFSWAYIAMGMWREQHKFEHTMMNTVRVLPLAVEITRQEDTTGGPRQGQWYVVFYKVQGGVPSVGDGHGWANTLPMAICLAILDSAKGMVSKRPDYPA